MTEEDIMLSLQEKLRTKIAAGDPCMPFYAAVVTADGTVVSEASNGVAQKNCSYNHAAMNAIRMAGWRLGIFTLARHDLTLYTTAEPCKMCVSGILPSGIKRVVYGVSMDVVERITGFDESINLRWRDEFSSRGISVVGPILPEVGEAVLRFYVGQLQNSVGTAFHRRPRLAVERQPYQYREVLKLPHVSRKSMACSPPETSSEGGDNRLEVDFRSLVKRLPSEALAHFKIVDKEVWTVVKANVPDEYGHKRDGMAGPYAVKICGTLYHAYAKEKMLAATQVRFLAAWSGGAKKGIRRSRRGIDALRQEAPARRLVSIVTFFIALFGIVVALGALGLLVMR